MRQEIRIAKSYRQAVYNYKSFGTVKSALSNLDPGPVNVEEEWLWAIGQRFLLHINSCPDPIVFLSPSQVATPFYFA